VWKEGRWWVRDNGSVNGIAVNDVRISESSLDDGDTLTFCRAADVPHNTTVRDTTAECVLGLFS
jgi:pSer/pThr/pTyr-binding forkhead associated (FHA) protein